MPNGRSEDNVVEVVEASNQQRGSGIKLINSTAEHIYEIMFFLWCLPYLPSHGDNCVGMRELKGSRVDISSLISLGNKIDEIKKAHPFTESLTMMRFLSSIAENHELREELNVLNGVVEHFYRLPSFTDYQNILSRLNKIEKNFNLSSIVRKTYFLKSLKKKENFASIFENFKKRKWHFYDLMNDEDFRQKYVYKALNEEDKSFSEDFKKSMDNYIKLVEEGKKVVNQYFKAQDVDVQAYYEEVEDNGNILHTNFVNYHGNEPIKTSDILQHDRNTRELNIYCNKKREVRVCREGSKRNYTFEEGACYQITSTWPVKDESGRVSTCTMIMNVGSDGITKIEKFSGREPNGKDVELSLEENKGLIAQNKELYIEGLLLSEAVEEFLKLQCRESVIKTDENKGQHPVLLPGVTPTITNSSLQGDDTIVANQKLDKKPDNQGNIGSNSTPTNSGASMTPTKVIALLIIVETNEEKQNRQHGEKI
ncbi:hypothetical protein [Candidatus Wolbachia massiliensis]|uniref:Uncharacterized protein n=1 Tax=Candidatus Wolbachia massiliensis TaxID=1845000 RepID=A0A7L7YQ33_9RICK|nr:hypothetical protein [Candidatus Wolbachia massiliensis]QOD38185.1 hypothetical protein ID128_05310 [Candidatus Wolbachia massiliensis]